MLTTFSSSLALVRTLCSSCSCLVAARCLLVPAASSSGRPPASPPSASPSAPSPSPTFSLWLSGACSSIMGPGMHVRRLFAAPGPPRKNPQIHTHDKYRQDSPQPAYK